MLDYVTCVRQSHLPGEAQRLDTKYGGPSALPDVVTIFLSTSMGNNKFFRVLREHSSFVRWIFAFYRNVLRSMFANSLSQCPVFGSALHAKLLTKSNHDQEHT